MGAVHRARLTMLGLLVLTAAAATSAQVVLPYGGYGYGLGGYYGVPYPYAAPHVIKPVVKEIEVPVETLEFKAHDTGCTNVFGNAVPCLAEGEARKKRDADEEEAPAAAPAVLPYGALPYGYAGLGYHYPYTTYAAPTVVAAKLPEPVVTEVEVPQYKFVPQVKTVELQPACQNGYGFAVPCI